MFTENLMRSIESIPYLVFFIQNFGTFVTKNKPSAEPAIMVPPTKIII